MVNSYRLYYFRKIDFLFSKLGLRSEGRVRRILKRLRPKPKSGMIIRTNYQFNLYIDPLYDKGIERSLYNTGTYEAGTLWCFKHLLRPGDIVVDAGANIGFMSIYAGKIVGKTGAVHSFEPLQSTFEILKRNILLNKLGNLTAYPIALSDFIGEAEIFPNIHINRGAASLRKKTENISAENHSVPVTTLDVWKREQQISNVNLIKIDVEGLELNLLKGATNLLQQEKKPILCLECSQELVGLEGVKKLFNFLQAGHGYRIFKSIRGKSVVSPLVEIKDVKDLPIHDNLFCFDEIVLAELPSALFRN